MESYGGISPYENDWEINNSVEYDCFSDQPYENTIYKNENRRKHKQIGDSFKKRQKPKVK